MINYTVASFKYVMSDLWFWPSMALTVIISMFVGALIYNGDFREVKKALIMLTTYVLFLLIVNAVRIFPQITFETTISHDSGHPIAGLATIVFVTFFYLFGLIIGVKLVKVAHYKK